MGYRQVYIKRSEKLNFKDNQLIVKKDDIETKVPLEDINYILLEDTTTIITSRLLSELGKNAICLIICDEKHEPSSIMYPYNFHYKQLENLEIQLKNTEEKKSEIWKQIIVSKITNQKSVLEKYTEDYYTIEKLDEFINTIEPGDITNREGLSAKMYFRSIFGSNFVRHYDDTINAALNYGYTILKSAMIRILSIYGLLTYYGINHKSKTNNFNLAYDLIEPFRSIIDIFIYNNIETLTEKLSYDIRKQLVDILNKEVMVNKKRYTVEYAMDLLVQSYIKCLSSEKIHLDLPRIIYG